MTASLTHIVLYCLTALFILQIVFYYHRTDINETHALEWSRTQSECVCASTTMSLNCYPRVASVSMAADSSQCGECFSCISTQMASGERKAETTFALSSHQTAINKVLVLLASIHKHYPSTKILIYDTEVGNTGLLEKQLVSVRNVIVTSSDVATKYTSSDVHITQLNVFFMLDALSRYESVLWLTDDLEFLSKGLSEVINTSMSPITTIGTEYITDIRKHAFASYFPGIFNARNYTLLLLKDGSQPTLHWIAKCAAEPSRRCWDCRDKFGETVDCMPSLLARLSLDTHVEHRGMPRDSIQHQRWQPTTCDARCFAYTFISILLFILVAIAVALLMLSKTTDKSM